MKKRDPVYLFLSVLEGMLSGGYFYLAKRDKEPVDLLTAVVWMACSVFHGLIGIRGDEGDIIVLEGSEDE